MSDRGLVCIANIRRQVTNRISEQELGKCALFNYKGAQIAAGRHSMREVILVAKSP